MGGLAFDLLSSKSPGQGSVIIGHANGVITINLAESLDDYRESMRIRLDEPYRTMLGHFRHEVGRYYQWQLVEAPGGERWWDCVLQSQLGHHVATAPLPHVAAPRVHRQPVEQHPLHEQGEPAGQHHRAEVDAQLGRAA